MSLGVQLSYPKQRTFISVAETGSFSKAAERLCKTTATISYRIKLLGENTGVGLF
ncbi:LysR family transcriptional regulator, partial [Salmonella enterica subsp. enterica serovar Kentucky]|nr:LysR family transcriptional regulator [Salmonella enterica subsp. enterica serovar Kentucky]